MDRLVEHLFVFEGNGEIRDFPGNYLQYRTWLKEQEKQEALPPLVEKIEKIPVAPVSAEEKKAKKLTYNQKREFDILAKEIAELEKEKATLSVKLNDGSIAFQELQQLSVRIGTINSLLEKKEMQWLEFSEYEQ